MAVLSRFLQLFIVYLECITLRTGSMNRSRLQSSVGLGNPGLLTPDRAGSVLLDEPAVEQGPLMEEDRSSTDSEDSEEEVSAFSFNKKAVFYFIK